MYTASGMNQMPRINYSTTDTGNWNLKLKERVKGSPQVEIRDGYGVVIVVSLGDGYIYKSYGKPGSFMSERTRGVNIHFALNGGLLCTFAEWGQIGELIQQARKMLGDESIDGA